MPYADLKYAYMASAYTHALLTVTGTQPRHPFLCILGVHRYRTNGDNDMSF